MQDVSAGGQLAGEQLASYQLASQLIEITPQLLWFALVAWVVGRYAPMLLSRLTSFRAGEVEIQLAREALDAAADSVQRQTVQIAEKDRQWQVRVPAADKRRALTRAQRCSRLLQGARLLWVDDRPENNNSEATMFSRLGVDIDTARDSTQALELVAAGSYDVIVSDMERDGDPAAGLGFLTDYHHRDGEKVPLVFYVGTLDPSKGTPAGAFGITNRPDELLHLVIDVLDRRARE